MPVETLASRVPNYTGLKKIVVGLLWIAAAVGTAALLFVWLPTTGVDLASVVVATVVALVAVALTGKVVDGAVTPENVARLSVAGSLVSTDDSGPLSPTGGGTTPTEFSEMVAEADEQYDGLIVEIDTGGGEPAAADEMRRTLERFDGPTIAYAKQTCASGGYLVAVGADEIWAHDSSLVGSIGVKYSQIRVSGLREQLGVSYDSITSGRYKEILTKFKALEDHERDRLQEITDEYHDQFVDWVTESRDLPRTTADGEAEVYTGREALEAGFVDGVGHREAVVDRMGELVGEEAVVDDVDEAGGIGARLTGSASVVAHAFGAGLGTAMTKLDESRFEL